jgi:iron complex outermembrane receptor protein
VAGIHVNRTPNSYSPLYVVRGIVSAFTPQILMLQNGVPVTTAYIGNKGNIWGGYPVEHIARIEIIRGPGSALYGSDAFSGVINIITKGRTKRPAPRSARAPAPSAPTTAGCSTAASCALDVAAYLRVGRPTASTAPSKPMRKPATTNCSAPTPLAPGQINNQYKAIDANLDLVYGQWRARFGYKRRYDMGSGAGIARRSIRSAASKANASRAA